MQSRPTVAVIVSDLHAGCQYGLCPPKIRMDGGGVYRQSVAQRHLWRHWRYLWTEMVPQWTEGRPFVLVVNGDAVDGRHHGATTQWSQNLADQSRCARECLELAFGLSPWQALYWVRGTEAHAGPAGESEEDLAKDMGAVPDSIGNSARMELWLRLAGGLAHITHTIGCTGSPAYETTALCREYVDAAGESAKWHLPAPDWVVRSHRHRHCEVRVPTKHGRATVVVTPGWQLRTPWVFKSSGGRALLPQIGACALIAGQSEFYSRSYVHALERSAPEVA